MGVGEERRADAAGLDEFARLAAHDLREPLGMVDGYLRLLHDRHSDRLDDEGREFLDYAVDGVERMQRMLADLLRYARLGPELDGASPSSVDANAAMQEARANLRLAIEESGGAVACDALPPVKAHRGQLAQVFQNLLANAIKFRGEEAPRVVVRATGSGRDVEFTVADNGIGLDPAHADRIFEPFERLVTADEYPGTGLGLAICRRIVEAHGGQIWVESEPGRGSTFHFTLKRGD